MKYVRQRFRLMMDHEHKKYEHRQVNLYVKKYLEAKANSFNITVKLRPILLLSPNKSRFRPKSDVCLSCNYNLGFAQLR